MLSLFDDLFFFYLYILFLIYINKGFMEEKKKSAVFLFVFFVFQN